MDDKQRAQRGKVVGSSQAIYVATIQEYAQIVPQLATMDVRRALAVFRSLGAACVPELVDGVARLALGVEQRGCERRARVSSTKGVPVRH